MALIFRLLGWTEDFLPPSELHVDNVGDRTHPQVFL